MFYSPRWKCRRQRETGNPCRARKAPLLDVGLGDQVRSGWISIFAGLVLAGCASSHEPSASQATTTTAAQSIRPGAGLVATGKYRIEREQPDGSYNYTGEAFMVPRGGAAYDLYWYRYRGEGVMGFGVLVDDVLGAVYQSETSQTTGLGVVVYASKAANCAGSA